MLAELSLPDLVKMALARPDRAATMFSTVEYARLRELGCHAQKAVVANLSPVWLLNRRWARNININCCK